MLRRSLLLLLPISIISTAFIAYPDIFPKGNLTSQEIEGSPYQFIENKGQWSAEVLYKLSAPGATLTLEKDRIAVQLVEANDQHGHAHETSGLTDHDHATSSAQGLDRVRGHNYHMQFLDAHDHTIAVAKKPASHYVNYFIGNDQDKWASRVKVFEEVQYVNLYEGIDLRFYNKDGGLKYDYVVAPGADYSKIKIQYIGADGLSIIDGNLRVETSVADVIEKAPVAYQDAHLTEPIACEYLVQGDVVTYRVTGDVNPDLPLIIDPELVFASYSGSTGDNWGFTATFDEDGNTYGGGVAFGAYPITPGAFQTSRGGGSTDMSISKFSEDGSTLIYSTFLGGNSSDAPHSMIVNSENQLVVMGSVGSDDWPTLSNSFDDSFNGGDFQSEGSLNYSDGVDIGLATLSEDGTALIASTYVGGSGTDGINNITPINENYGDAFRGEIVLDNEDNVVVISSTSSRDFPVTSGAFDDMIDPGSEQDACVFKVSKDMSSMIWSTYLGGEDDQAGISVRVSEADQSVYVQGWTMGSDFPTTERAFKTNYVGGPADAFVTRISADGSELMASTFLGTTNEDYGYLLDLDRAGNVYAVGQSARGEYPISDDVYSVPSSSLFLQKLDADLSVDLLSTQLGNGSGGLNGRLVPTAFLIDNCNRIYLSAWGGGTNNGDRINDMPLTSDAFQSSTDGSDFYLMVLEPDASALTYGSYIGGDQAAEHVDGGTSRFDKRGIVYQAVCSGCGGFSDFPVTSGAVSERNNSSNCNIAVFKFDFQLEPISVEAEIESEDVCLGDEVTFINLSVGADRFVWDFGDGTGSTDVNPTHTYSDPGVYDVTLVGSSDESCEGSDEATLQIVVTGTDCGSLSAGPDQELDDEDDLVLLEGVFSGCGTFSWTGGTGTFSDRLDPLSSYMLSDEEAEAGCAILVAVLSDSLTTCTDTMKISVFVPESTQLLWDLNDCEASIGQTKVYDEFEVLDFDGISCADIEVSNIFRLDPQRNRHSCTLGPDSTRAMCVSSLDDCEYVENSSKAVRFTVSITTVDDKSVTIESLNFWEAAPETFDWIGGADGDNDRPTFYGLRVVKDGTEIFREIDIATTTGWTLESFDFGSVDEFSVVGSAVFQFELLPYCTSSDDDLPINAWDIDDVTLTLSCTSSLTEAVAADRSTSVRDQEQEIFLFPNSPNPFSDFSYFAFRMEKSARASFVIFTAQGQELYRKDGNFEAGHHTLRITSADLQGYRGMLYYSVTTTEQRAVKSAIIE